MNKEVLEDGSPARGVRGRLLVSLLRLWTALLDERLRGLLLVIVVVSILVLVTFFILFLFLLLFSAP
jgi:hypothetical protein